MHLLIELGLLILSYFANRAISNYLLSRQKPPKPGGFEVPVIPAGACIPVVYGTRRVRPIWVYMAYAKLVEFNAESKNTFGIVSKQTLGYGYKTTGQLVLCWGAIDCVRNMIFGTNEKSLADVPTTQSVPAPSGWPTPTVNTYGGFCFVCGTDGPNSAPHTDSIEAYAGGMAEMTLFLPRIFGGLQRGGMFSAGGGDQNNPYGGTIRLYTGTRRTGPDAILESYLGTGKVPAYNELTYLVYNDVQIGEGSTPEPVDYIISRYPWDDMVIPGGSGTPVVNSRLIQGKEWQWTAADCSGAAIIYDLLRNPLYGLGIPDHMIVGAGIGSSYGISGTFEDAQRQLVAEGLGLSMVFSGDRGKAQDAIDEVLRTIDAVLVRDPETFKYRLKLIRNEAINPAALAAIREFTPKDIRELKPVTRNNWRETHNVITVEFSNAEKFYNKDTVTVRNEANIAMTGGERALTVQYMAVTDRRVALNLAARDLKRESLQLWKGQMKLTRVGWDLERGDVFKLTFPEYGFSQMLCRVLSIDFGDETDTTITVTWIEDVFNYDNVLRPAEVPPPILYLPTIIDPIISNVKQEVVTIDGLPYGKLTITLYDPERRTYEIAFRTSVGGATPSAWDVVATAVANTSDPQFPYINPVCAPDLNGDYVYLVPLTYKGQSTIQYQIKAVGYGLAADFESNNTVLQDTFTFAALPTPSSLSVLWSYRINADGTVTVTVDGLSQITYGDQSTRVRNFDVSINDFVNFYEFDVTDGHVDPATWLTPPWVTPNLGSAIGGPLAPGQQATLKIRVHAETYDPATNTWDAVEIDDQMTIRRADAILKYPVWNIGDQRSTVVLAAGDYCFLTLPAGKLTAWKVQCTPAATMRFDLWKNSSGLASLPTVADSLGLSFGPNAAEIAEGTLPDIDVADGDNAVLVVLSNDVAVFAAVTLTLEVPT